MHNEKLIGGLLAAMILSASTAFPAMATDGISVTLNGIPLSFDVPPQIINDRTMVPLRAIFEALGASVDWDDSTRTVTSSKDGITISLTVDSITMYVNGNAVTLDSPACIVDGRTLVPVRAISEAYNTDVEWDGNTRTVTITSNNTSAPVVSIPAPDTSSSNTQSSNTPVASKYELLRQQIIGKGTLLDTGNYGIMYNVTDSIHLYLITDNDYVGLGLTMDGNTSDESETIICIYESGTVTCSTTLNSVMGDLTFMYICDNGQWVEMGNNTNSAFQADAYDLLTAQVDLINTCLPKYGYGLTLEDFGIPVSTESSANASNQLTIYDRAAIMTADQFTMYDELHDYIVKNGTYYPENDSYGILDIWDSETDTFLSATDDSIGFIFTLTYNGGATIRQGTFILKKNEPILAIGRTIQSGVEQQMIGYFFTNDKQFHLVDGNEGTSIADDAKSIFRSTFIACNGIIYSLGFDWNLMDFGMSFDS